MDFTIIIPTKNEGTNLARCLRSIMNVEWPHDRYEILVIDNGSADSTVEIALDHGARVLQLPGITVAALRNRGAEVATGTLLAFLDADCTVDRTWLACASKYLNRMDVAAFGSPPGVPEKGTWVQLAWYEVRRKKIAGDTDWLESMNMFVRRDAFMQIGGFNSNLITCEDYDLSIRLRRIGRLVCDQHVIATHHGEARSVPHFFRKERWRGIGNLQGAWHHGLTWQELPSIALPAVHILFMILVLLLLITACTIGSRALLVITGTLLAAWQLPIIAVALLKNGSLHLERLRLGFQLYLLLNVYYTARGSILLQQIRGAR